MEIRNYRMDLPVIKLVTQSSHLSPNAKLPIDDPIVNLLIGVLGGMLAAIQCRRSQLIGVTLPVLAVTDHTGPLIHSLTLLDEIWF
jgi:hypothetical protein